MRSDIGVICFSWEKHLPFIPWMILPYMSLDLFFVASPFYCKSRGEKRALEKRIVFAILFSGTCFLLFPLKCTFIKPHVDGVLGWIFSHFLTMDKPYNQLPSLHIVLSCILAEHFSRHTRGLLRRLLLSWFALSALSTLFTFQHHFIDLIGGFFLAVLCFALFPQPENLVLQLRHSHRIGLYYATASLVFFGIAWFCGGWFSVFFWPALSLVFTALAYWVERPLLLQKRNGKITWFSKLLLAPILFGQKLSLLYYAQQARPWDRLTSNVWIGRRLSSDEAVEAINQGVTAVLDLTNEFDEVMPFLSVTYHNIPLLDLTSPSKEQVDDAISFISLHSKNGVVYIHCKAGYSRTAAVAGTWLLLSGEAIDAEDAIKRLRAARPEIVIRSESEILIRGMAAFKSDVLELAKKQIQPLGSL